ncbi:hypothetical protein THRCLA_01241 [Thraustotheca clavata]|uniref:FYVE-type domain-containing protein n=1 Tax=Thraustotheca clavata TaxID=74557 RepID=A0A1W0A9N9_9STRA|nr:hypothetical protein THRCLA_01241 [Thraustotheca clavata]
MAKKKSLHYPLPNNYFQCPELSDAHHDAFLKLGKTNLHNFLEKTMYPDESMVWHFDSDWDGVKLYEGSIVNKGLVIDKHNIPYRAIAKVHATIDEVANLHDFNTRDQCLQYIEHITSDMVDMIPLYTLHTPSPKHPHRRMYLKWCATHSPMPMIKDRDFVYIEAQDEFLFASGRRGWGLCQYSVDLPFAPCLQETAMGLVRGTLYQTGIVFLESDTAGVLDVIYHIASDFKGSIPHFVCKMGIKKRAHQIHAINEYIHHERIHSRPAKTYSLGAGRRTIKCVSCGENVRYRVGTNCKSCHEPVCSKCSTNWHVHNDGIEVTVRVCHHCAASAQDAALWETSSSRHLTSTSSRSGSHFAPSKVDEHIDMENLKILYDNLTPHHGRFGSVDDGVLTLNLKAPNQTTTPHSTQALDLSYLTVYTDTHKPEPLRRRIHQDSHDDDEDEPTRLSTLTKEEDPELARLINRKTYPLPDNFFPVPELSDAEQSSYLQAGEEAFKNFLQNVLGPENPTIVWKPFGEFHGVKIVEADVPGFKVDRNLLPCRMTAKIRGTVDEVAMLHASDTRQHCAEYVDQYSGDILDVIPLYSLIDRSEKSPYKQCYIKWSAHLSPVVMIRDRDFVFVEMQDLVELPSGRRGWAYCRASINLMSVPSLEKTHLKLVRGVLHHFGAVFMENPTAPGMLDVIAQMAMDSKGSIPQWVRKLGMKNNVRQITLVEDYVHKLRMSSRISKGNSFLSTSSSSMTSVPQSTSSFKRCALCQAPSSPFKRFKNCESCGDLVCSRCSSLWNVNIQGKPRVRVCNACAKDAQNGGAWEIQDSEDAITSATNSSRDTLYDVLASTRSSSAMSSQRQLSLPTDTITMDKMELQKLNTITTAAAATAPSKPVDMAVDLSYLSIYTKQKTPEEKPEPSRSSLVSALDNIEYPPELEDDDDNDVTSSTLDSVNEPVRDSSLEAFLKQIGHVHVASQQDSFADRHTLPYRAISRINATLEEVAQIHNFDTREKCLTYVREYAGDIVDMIPLYNLSENLDDPMQRMYIKWVACTSPVPIIRDRDFVFLETQRSFVHNDRKGWAFCQYSVDLACCPSLKDTELNIVRGTLHYTGAVFLENENSEELDVIYHVASNFKGHIPLVVRKIHIRNRAARKITNIEEYIKRARMNQYRVNSYSTLFDRCAVCSHASKSSSHLEPCTSCNLAVCMQCSRTVTFNTGPSVRLCQICSIGYRQGLVNSSRSLSCLETTRSSSSGESISPSQKVHPIQKMDLSYLDTYRYEIPEESPTALSSVSSSCILSKDKGFWGEDESFLHSMAPSKPYPLPDDFFPSNVLSDARRRELISFGEIAFDSFLQQLLLGDFAVAWNLLNDRADDIMLYEGHAARKDKQSTPYLATTTIPGDVDAIAQLHQIETHEECIVFIKKYAIDIMDMAVLDSFAGTQTSKRMSIKWCAVTTQWPLMIKDRDFLYLEVHDTFRMPDGRYGWGYCQNSIELHQVPTLTRLQLVRGTVHQTGCLFIESKLPGCVDVIYHIASDLKGLMPAWVRKQCVKYRVRQIRICERPSSNCFHRMHKCDVCRKLVCSKCSQTWKRAPAPTVLLCTYCSGTIRARSACYDGSAPRKSHAPSSASLPTFNTPVNSFIRRASVQQPGQDNRYTNLDLSYLSAYSNQSSTTPSRSNNPNSEPSLEAFLEEIAKVSTKCRICLPTPLHSTTIFHLFEMTPSRKKLYPVPTDLFDCPKLSPEQFAEFVNMADDVLATFLSSLAIDSKDDWRLVSSHSDGTRVYESQKPTKDNEDIYPIRAKTKVKATLEEIATLHTFDTRDDCLNYIHNYAPDIVDIIPLYTFYHRSESHPLKQTYIKWTVVQSPIPVFVDRDFLYIEVQDEIVFSNGRRGWAFVQNSIELPWVPTLESTDFKLVRSSHHYTGALFLESEKPGTLDLIYNVAVDVKGAMPAWLVCEGCMRKWRRRGWNSVRLCLVCCPEGQQPPRDVQELMSKMSVGIEVPKQPKHQKLAAIEEKQDSSPSGALDLSYLQVYKTSSCTSSEDGSPPYFAHCIPEEPDEGTIVDRR